MIDEDLPHQSGGEREEVGAVAPVDRLGSHEPQIGFVDQVGGLEAVPRRSRAMYRRARRTQLRVDEG